jgi:hypothetical protein
VYDELMRMEDEDLIEALQAAVADDDGLCSDGVESRDVSKAIEGEIELRCPVVRFG